MQDVPALSPPLSLLEGASLFLDFDGTLVNLADTPDAVEVDGRLADLMRRLEGQLDRRIAVISGRPAAQVRALLGTDLAVVGSHGMEFVARDGTATAVERPMSLMAVREAMNVLVGRHRGALVEDKPLGVALHFRLCPDAETDCLRLAEALAAEHALHLQPGKMMIEVRAAGGDKGTAIGTLMREPGMAGTRPVFMGDDLTDEPGFAAASELGGAGILVGSPRPSAAQYRLDGVEAALGWLEAAAAGNS